MISFKSRIALGIAFVAGLLTACADAPEPIVFQAEASTRLVTPQGPVVGSLDQYGAQQWLGIPFAQAPVNDLRWRAPRAHPGWDQERPALTFGSPCAQYGSPFAGATGDQIGAPVGSEDCLFLNIWRPAEPSGELPVMVWIHGGSNVNGHGGFYQGGNLAATQDVLVISINYRMGPFGWFGHPSLAADGSPLDASGNYGTLDAIEALKWVKANVAAYGGNPRNVTVFGESAGGTNIYSLLLSPLAKNLFHKAIIQSGGVRFASATSATNFIDDEETGDPSSSNEIILKLLVSDGLASDRASAKRHLADMSDDQLAQYLRSQPTFRFYNHYLDDNGSYTHYPPRVIAEGRVIRRGDPLELLSDPDTHLSVPVLAGTNRDEPKIFMAFDENQVQRAFGLPLYPHDREIYDLRAKYGGLAWKRRAVDAPAAALTRNSSRVFAYRWDWDEQGTRFGFLNLTQLLGAAHGLEIPFVFGHWNIGPQSDLLFGEHGAAERIELSAAMMSYWANFAHTGKPDRGRQGNLPNWKPWDSVPGEPKMMILDSANDSGLRMTNTEVNREFLVEELTKEPLGQRPDHCLVFDELFEGEVNQAWVESQRGRICG